MTTTHATAAIHHPGLLSALGMAVATEAETSPWAAEVRLARSGNADAFASLVRRVQRPVYGLCLRLLTSEAEAKETAQETFLRAYQNLHRFDDSRAFDLWVLAIARNLCLDILRRRQKLRTDDVDDHRETLPSGAQNQEERVLAGEARQSLEAAMETLSVDDREVLALYYVQRRTTKEIAEVMGVAPGTIMARLFRAREKLRKHMTAQEEGQP